MKVEKIKKSMLLLYILLIPFLCPRGFFEYFSGYKLVFTLWLYFSVSATYFLFLCKGMKGSYIKNKYMVWITVYFIFMGLITLTVKGNFTDGLQKIFATPALCLLTYMEMKRNPREYIQTVNRLTFFLVALNVLVFNQIFFSTLFQPDINHLTFLGHVQLSAQLGVLLIFISYINYKLYTNDKRKHCIEVLFALLTMLLSFTSASYLALFILAIFLFLNYIGLKKMFTYSSIVYFISFLVCNAVLFYLVKNDSIALSIANLSLNGRGFIWTEAIDNIIQKPIVGYGVHGVLIEVFWSKWVNDGVGMNYVHNQILQTLLDGGIILLLPFLFALYSSMDSINKIRDFSMRFWNVILVCIMLIIMSFESCMDYFYIFIYFTVLSCLPYAVKRDNHTNNK